MQEKPNFPKQTESSHDNINKEYNDSLIKSAQIASDFNVLMTEDKEMEYAVKSNYEELERQRKELVTVIDETLTHRVSSLKTSKRIIPFEDRIEKTPELHQAFTEMKHSYRYAPSEYVEKINKPFLRGLTKVVSSYTGLGIPTVIVTDNDNCEITIQKDGIQFVVKCSFYPTKNGMTGRGRIFGLRAERDGEKGEAIVCNFYKKWLMACEDPQIQKEIDLIIATLG